ncbi:type II toxin-antitoxin system ParD family antitoxin [Methylomonas albis]|uniref:Antitoxin ParD n=1 Tax=Methylomonas albis TaxID=1854563 RepID=A0ABR9D5G6_9GAMM|nr:type II toxin-antitoxin system ParD family antitoxin [Methylomonas albis]MBD9358364.1 type II toxin-antitoxin system ParD family antitoxin [Methylomonas albis]
MAMQRKTITLTDKLESWVKIQVDSGKFGNDSEYFRDLVRRDQERQEAETRLRNFLDDAEASGFSERNPQEIWAAAEASSPVNNG